MYHIIIVVLLTACAFMYAWLYVCMYVVVREDPRIDRQGSARHHGSPPRGTAHENGSRTNLGIISLFIIVSVIMKVPIALQNRYYMH